MCKLTIKDQILKGRTMKKITLLICLLFPFSITAAEKIESKSEKIQQYKDTIKRIDKIIIINEPYFHPETGEELSVEDQKNSRKIIMDALVELEGEEKKTKIRETCINKYNGWTQTWTKENNPKKTCQKNEIADLEECAIKSGKAQTDTAANLIYKKCKRKAESTANTCGNNHDEKYKHIIPKYEKCVDQAYLAD